MKVDDLKKIAARFGSVVVLNDEGPSFVVLSFKKYQELLGESEKELTESHFSKISSNGLKPAFSVFEGNNLKPEVSRENEVLEVLNREISALKEEIKLREGEIEESIST